MRYVEQYESCDKYLNITDINTISLSYNASNKIREAPGLGFSKEFLLPHIVYSQRIANSHKQPSLERAQSRRHTLHWSLMHQLKLTAFHQSVYMNKATIVRSR